MGVLFVVSLRVRLGIVLVSALVWVFSRGHVQRIVITLSPCLPLMHCWLMYSSSIHLCLLSHHTPSRDVLSSIPYTFEKVSSRLRVDFIRLRRMS